MTPEEHYKSKITIKGLERDLKKYRMMNNQKNTEIKLLKEHDLELEEDYHNYVMAASYWRQEHDKLKEEQTQSQILHGKLMAENINLNDANGQCGTVIAHLDIKIHNLKQKLEKIDKIQLPFEALDELLEGMPTEETMWALARINLTEFKEILESNQLKQLDSGLADNSKESK